MASKKMIEKTLIHRLHEQKRFGQSKHAAKQEARERYLKEHGNLKGYNPAKVDGIYSYSTMNTYTAAMRPLAEWAHSHGMSRGS